MNVNPDVGDSAVPNSAPQNAVKPSPFDGLSVQDVARALVFSTNLMDRGRFRHLDKAKFVTSAFEFEDASQFVDVAIVDLSITGSLAAVNRIVQLRSQNPKRILAYTGHVERDTLETAQQISGVDAFARSVFFKKLENLGVS